MKKKYILALLILAVSLYSYSQTSGFGIGIIFGEPTGISCKLWVSSTSAFDCGAAWSFLEDENQTDRTTETSQLHLAFHLDYLFHVLPIFTIPGGSFAFYCGAGGRIKILDNGIIAGIRLPLGINYLFKNFPIDIFLEIVPVMEIYPATELNGNGGLGVRYFF
ncbi:MAG: DUF3996 domain-containing protein [Spirochaetales bacterium]|nr:DUF3996 domain-containing protein [Spirochaetales bacterium]